MIEFSVSHFSVRSSSLFFCLTFFCLFAKAIEPYLNRDFELGRWTSSAQLPLVNLLVEESAKLVVDLEDMPHHVIGDSAEIVLF